MESIDNTVPVSEKQAISVIMNNDSIMSPIGMDLAGDTVQSVGPLNETQPQIEVGGNDDLKVYESNVINI